MASSVVRVGFGQAWGMRFVPTQAGGRLLCGSGRAPASSYQMRHAMYLPFPRVWGRAVQRYRVDEVRWASLGAQ